jgi:ABC-2 type transport system ATP-binding protein
MTSLPDFAIQATQLDKTYAPQGSGAEKHALKAIDLAIPRGSVFGLLGPNGAGKSTFINILAGMVMKTGGKASIWGVDIDEDPRNARAGIGIVPQEISLDAFFTPKEILNVQAGLYGVPKAERRTTELLELVGLSDKANTYSRTLSGGMRRRLMVAKAMVHNPPVLVLDEPTAGVDIELRRGLWETVRALNARGVTIVLTTHYLEEAEELCDRIAIINHGEIVANDFKSTLLQELDLKDVVLTFDTPVTTVPEALQPFSAKIMSENQIKLTYHSRETSIQEILGRIADSGLGLRDIATRESDLEDIFLSFTRKKAA